jgi:peptidoglycan/LPS O-acetylase OafA/YrhL
VTADRRGPAAPERTAAPQHTAAAEGKAASRVIVLDGLRFMAATMVVLYHYVGVPRSKIGKQGTAEVLAWGTSASRVFPHALNVLAGFGWTGVEMFFIISGFVICMSGWGRRPADFFISRVVRLVPAYWAAIALTGGVLVAFPRLTGGIRPSMVLTNLSMVQGAYGVPNLNPAFWTLFIELKFYLLFGLAAIGGVTYRRMVTFCVLWSVGSIAAVGSHNSVLALLMSPRYSPYFIAGIAFYLIHRFGSNLLLWAIVIYSWLLTLDNPRAYPRWEVTVLLTSFFVIMALVATHRLDWIRWRWLTLAGALTYPLYLIHQDVGFTVIAYLHGRVPAPLLAAATFAAMLALAWLIHRAVERPIAPLLPVASASPSSACSSRRISSRKRAASSNSRLAAAARMRLSRSAITAFRLLPW